ncbi:hypothetical protein [Maribacter sp. LLG6340-A2]|uniref:hypothetical protein n=1 Tax=Maribacter sp. LLG6340-A2 TaxID=3160834 RepID=UPI00386CFBFF
MKTKILTVFTLFLIVTKTYCSVVVMNGLTHTYSGVSGDVITGEIVLINSADEAQRVTFELNDIIFSCTENRIFTSESTHSQSSVDWFSAELMDKTLRPKEKYIYRFTISIPSDQNLKGSFWSTLMVNVEKPIKEEALNSKVGLDTKIRYAVALLTDVNLKDEVNIDFKSIDLNNEDSQSKKELFVKVSNESKFIEGVKLTLEVYDQDGEKIYESETDRNMAFPGFCRDFKLDVSSLAIGEYECVLIAESREEFIGANITLTID